MILFIFLSNNTLFLFNVCVMLYVTLGIGVIQLLSFLVLIKKICKRLFKINLSLTLVLSIVFQSTFF